MTKAQKSETKKRRMFWTLENLDLRFVSDFDIRISDLFGKSDA